MQKAHLLVALIKPRLCITEIDTRIDLSFFFVRIYIIINIPTQTCKRFTVSYLFIEKIIPMMTSLRSKHVEMYS